MSAIVPLVDAGLGNSSYLVGVGDGRALVVDPSRDPGPYLRTAERHGWRVTDVAETHLHADFVSGARELAAGGARLLAPARARLGFPATALDDGDEVDLGGLSLRALATPGHTPEHLAYLLADGDRPLAVFTGGTLITGGVARPDLLGPEHTEALARAAHRSIRQRLLALPDDLPVYPTHGPGSFCSAGPGAERVTTIGYERRHNPLLQTDDEDAFVARLLGGLGSYPPYFLRLREVNRAGPRLYGAAPPALAGLSVDETRRALHAGAELVDVRAIEAFAAGHLPGSLSIPLRDQFAVWLGWLLPLERPLVFVCAADTDRAELVRQCRKIGYEQVLGELAGGPAAWQAAGGAVARIALVSPGGVGADRRVLDVRQDSEWAAGHIPGAAHVELGALPRQAGALGRAPLLVHCAHGPRAMTAASLLRRAGHADLQVLAGGPEEWSQSSGRGLERA